MVEPTDSYGGTNRQLWWNRQTVTVELTDSYGGTNDSYRGTNRQLRSN